MIDQSLTSLSSLLSDQATQWKGRVSPSQAGSLFRIVQLQSQTDWLTDWLTGVPLGSQFHISIVRSLPGLGSDWVTRDNRDTSGLVLTGEKIEIMSSLLPSGPVVHPCLLRCGLLLMCCQRKYLNIKNISDVLFRVIFFRMNEDHQSVLWKRIVFCTKRFLRVYFNCAGSFPTNNWEPAPCSLGALHSLPPSNQAS